MIAPLSIDLSTAAAKTAFPLIADKQYAKWRLTKLELAENDVKHEVAGLAGPNGKPAYIKMEYDLVDPAPADGGGQVEPGKPGGKFFENIQLYAKLDAKDQAWFVKKLCTRIDALLGTSDADNKKGKSPRPEFALEDPSAKGSVNQQAIGELAAALLGNVLLAQMAVSTYEGTTRNEFRQVVFPADMGA